MYVCSVCRSYRIFIYSHSDIVTQSKANDGDFKNIFVRPNSRAHKSQIGSLYFQTSILREKYPYHLNVCTSNWKYYHQFGKLNIDWRG